MASNDCCQFRMLNLPLQRNAVPKRITIWRCDEKCNLIGMVAVSFFKNNNKNPTMWLIINTFFFAKKALCRVKSHKKPQFNDWVRFMLISPSNQPHKRNNHSFFLEFWSHCFPFHFKKNLSPPPDFPRHGKRDYPRGRQHWWPTTRYRDKYCKLGHLPVWYST